MHSADDGSVSRWANVSSAQNNNLVDGRDEELLGRCYYSSRICFNRSDTTLA